MGYHKSCLCLTWDSSTVSVKSETLVHKQFYSWKSKIAITIIYMYQKSWLIFSPGKSEIILNKTLQQIVAHVSFKGAIELRADKI